MHAYKHRIFLTPRYQRGEMAIIMDKWLYKMAHNSGFKFNAEKQPQAIGNVCVALEFADGKLSQNLKFVGN